MTTTLLFLLVISLLVFVHELGHFVAARRSGMKVEEFGFGFPPRLWGKKIGDTVYTINAIPFGGFVRIFGEDGGHTHAPGSFAAGKFWHKCVVLVAGVVMNIVLAVALLSLGNMLGLRVGIFDEASRAEARDIQVQILEVSVDSPAQRAGLLPADAITGFVGPEGAVEVASPEDVQKFAFSNAGKEVTIVVQRAGSSLALPIALRTPESGQGPIGIALALTGEVSYPWYEALWKGVQSTWYLTKATVEGYGAILVSLVTSGSLGAGVTGPVGIATMTGQAAQAGMSYLIQFVAMISINLAVLNIMPFPALDGGRLVLVVLERIRGRALANQTEQLINAGGFALLLLLMVAVTVRDVVTLF